MEERFSATTGQLPDGFQTDEKLGAQIPLNVVQHSKKLGKTRLVCDAAACIHGKPLNSKLLKGSDLVTSLPIVISHATSGSDHLLLADWTGDVPSVMILFKAKWMKNRNVKWQHQMWRKNAGVLSAS